MSDKRTRLERETVIVYNELEDTASIWTASERMMNKLLKAGYTPTDKTQGSKTFVIPKKLISIRKGQTRKKMSPEQLKATKERLLNARMARSE